MFSLCCLGQQVIVTYTFDSIPSTTVGAKNPSYVSPSCTASIWSNGVGVSSGGPTVNGQTATPTDRAYIAQNWSLTGVDPADYFQFTVTSNTGYSFQPTSIRFVCRRSNSNNGPTLLTIRYGGDGYTANIFSTAIPSADAWHLVVGNFTPLPPALTFTFRIYGYQSTVGNA